MTSELSSLLALQADDDIVDGLLEKLAALEPRRRALEATREAAERHLNQARAAVAEDEHRQRELEGRISDHKQRQERNLAHLDAVKRMREATAATLQVESGRKILLEEEAALRTLVTRIADGHATVKAHEAALREMDAAQAAERAALEQERQGIDAELADAKGKRAATSAGVRGTLLSKYERIRGRRRSQAVFALSDGACACCDTAVPVQRRILMTTSGSIEVCETCGVLLYAMEG